MYGGSQPQPAGTVATVDKDSVSPTVPAGDYDPYAKRQGKIDNFSNVMMQDRRCRDIFCCILFILFWGGMIVVAVFAFQQGDPRKIIYGTDYEGNTCGTAITGQPRDVSTLPYLYWPKFSLTAGLNTTFGICVNACPSTSNGIVCMYGFSATAGNVAAGYCFTTYNSTFVFYRCIPSFGNATATLSAYSILNSPTQLLNQALGTISEAWWVILAMAGGAVVLSFIWICLMRCCAGCMVWLSILFMFAAAIALDFFLFFIAFGVNPWSCVPGVGSVSTCIDGIPNLGKDVNSYVLLGFAIALAVVIFIFFIVICCMCSRIRLAIQLVKEASKASGAMPLIFFFPIIIFIFVGGLAVYWLYVLVYLASAPGLSVYVGSYTFGYVTSDQMKYVILYHIFGLLWTLGFFMAIGQTTIAGAVGSWYFTYPIDNEGTKVIEGYPISTSFGRTLRYHLGSLAFGSLIIAIVQLIRIILAYIEYKLKGDGPQNRCIVCLLRCMSCCLACFERFLRFLNKNAYIEIALFGYSFCDAAKTAFEMILRNILRMAAVDKVGDFLMFLGKLAVAAGCGLGAFMLMQYYLAWLQLYVVVVAIVAIIGYFIATAFFAVFQMTIDTLLLCFLEDIERHGPRDDTPGQKFYMSKELYEFLSDREKKGGGNSCCC